MIQTQLSLLRAMLFEILKYADDFPFDFDSDV